MSDKVYLVIFDGEQLVDIIDHTGYEQRVMRSLLSDTPVSYISSFKLNRLKDPHIYAIETALTVGGIPLDEVRRCGEKLI